MSQYNTSNGQSHSLNALQLKTLKIAAIFKHLKSSLIKMSYLFARQR